MLTKGEAVALLSLRNSHHGNAQWDDLQLDAFHAELRADITADEAREALRRFYAADHEGRWCGSGDINAIVRRMRSEGRPTEAQIGRECEKRRLTTSQSWEYRRRRMRGEAPDEAEKNVLPGRNVRQVETPGRHAHAARHRTGAPAPIGGTSLTAILKETR